VNVNEAGLAAGDVGAGFTVSVAALLVTLPAELLTATVNSAPLSEVATGGVEYVDVFVPGMFVPFFSHW